jgi:hypothetical protein
MDDLAHKLGSVNQLDAICGAVNPAFDPNSIAARCRVD